MPIGVGVVFKDIMSNFLALFEQNNNFQGEETKLGKIMLQKNTGLQVYK